MCGEVGEKLRVAPTGLRTPKRSIDEQIWKNRDVKVQRVFK